MIINLDFGHILVLLAIIIITGLVTYEYFYPYQGQQSKCFDCEKEIESNVGHGMGYIGGTSKCFDCEAQMIGSGLKRYGIFPEMGSSSKCFSCENQYNPTTSTYSSISHVNESNLDELEYFTIK